MLVVWMLLLLLLLLLLLMLLLLKLLLLLLFLLLLLLSSCFMKGGVSSFYVLPGSAFLLFRDGPQAPDLTCFVKLPRLCSFWGCCCCGFGGLLRAGSCKMDKLLAGQTEGPPALNDHHHIFILICCDMK